MNEPIETIMEVVREDFMVSHVGDSEPTFRTAHFLKPIANAVNDSAPSLLPPFFENKEWPLSIHFNGWRSPRAGGKWVKWVSTLHPKYESLWKRVGIFDAIMSTKCCITKNQHLILGIAEKWCSKTKTFVFPWGEATVTLEDIMILGAYPVIGKPVFATVENQEMREAEEKLVLARKELWKSKHVKASMTNWMDIFISSSSEIEHEAFLATWLSMFVFPGNSTYSLVNSNVFPIAVHLARGNQIALAPAVLANIYKDLGLLRKTIIGLSKNAIAGDDLFEVTTQSPFYLVQAWVWERFKNLQPQPNFINNGDTLLCRWHKVNKALKIDNLRLELDSAKEHFLWRPYPYVRHAGKCRLFYQENEIFVPLYSNCDNDLVSSLATCTRVSELVGPGCSIQQYLRHRVSMQFGFDQDVPGYVVRFNQSEAMAWEHYCRPISERNFHLPSRLFEADVTTRYTMWWKQSVLGHEDPVMNIVQKKRSLRPSKGKRSRNDADVPPGFSPKLTCIVISEKSCQRKGDYDAVVLPGFLPKRLKIITSGNCVQYGLKSNQYFDGNVATGFPPKHSTLSSSNFFEDCKPVFEETKCGDMTNILGKVTTAKCKDLSNQSSLSSVADCKDVNTEPSREGMEKNFKCANGSKESIMSSDRVSMSGTHGEGNSCGSQVNVVKLEQRITRLERVIAELKRNMFGQS